MPKKSMRPIKSSTSKTAKARKLAKQRREKAMKLAARRFQDRNRRFLKLPVPKQRLKILQDVISHLEAEKMVAKTDQYLRIKGIRRQIGTDEALHEVLEQGQCEVCGIGGMFTAAVLLKNKLKVGALDKDPYNRVNFRLGHAVGEPMRKYLGKWFSDTQLELIETAFEVKDNFADKINEDQTEQAMKFGRKHRSAKTRLLAICNNMLENNGKFVLPKGKVEGEEA